MTKLTDEELVETLDVQLPDLLDRHPELQKRVYDTFLQAFARRDEVAAVISELRALHSDVDDFSHEVIGRFDRVDQRLDGMDQRFDRVDQRLDGMDQRFDRVDQRLDGVDQRFDSVESSFQDLRDWVELVVGRLQVRSGRNLEDVVAGAMRLTLKRLDIRPESIRLRQKIVDTEGFIYPAGRQKEVDLIATDGEFLVFEVKSAAEVDDVDDFAEKVRLFEHLHPDRTVRGIFITLAAEPDVKARCAELGIELAH